MSKKKITRTCSHCDELIPEGEEYIEFKGSYFHPDQLTCIKNMKEIISSLLYERAHPDGY